MATSPVPRTGILITVSFVSEDIAASRPPGALLGVAALFTPDVLVEIEAIAVVD